MPRGTIASRRGGRRPTLSDAPSSRKRTISPGAPGLSEYTPGEIFTGPIASGVLPGAVDVATRIPRTIAEGVTTGLDYAAGAFWNAGQEIFDRARTSTGELAGNTSIFGAYANSGSPTPSTQAPAPVTTQRDAAAAAAESALSAADVIRKTQNAPLPFEARASLEQFRLEKQAELDQIAKDIENLERQESSYEANWTADNALLEAIGLPSSIDALRADPEVGAALDEITKAIDTGTGLDAAIDNLSEFTESELEDMQQAYGREWYMAQIQTSIRNQMYNLVENRQGIEQQMVDYEQWLNKEAQAQELNLWDYQGDPSPAGRGLDTVTTDVEAWLDNNYSGIMTDAQFDTVATAINMIWNSPNTLSEEELTDEEGNPIERPVVDEQSRGLLLQLATSGIAVEGGIAPGLGLTQSKAEAFVNAVVQSVQRGRETAFAVDDWENAQTLEPGSAQAFAAIAEVAEDVYQDPEIAETMAKSDFIHRLMLMRSGGNVNHEGRGNQFGLFALPEHTYEVMGYNVEDLRDNPKEQIEAFLQYIGYWGGYGAGYEGLQAAVSDLMHNPDTWGDI